MLIYMKRFWAWAVVAMISGGILLTAQRPVFAANNFPDQQGSGSIGLQGTISSAPPSRGATIVTPSNGAVITTLPVTVSGLCPAGVLVKIFSNNVFVGSTVCSNGSYSVQVDL